MKPGPLANTGWAFLLGLKVRAEGEEMLLPPNKDSETKARYALAVLKVAKSADQATAARLLEGLARDIPHPSERPEIASLHYDAIDHFKELSGHLRASGATSVLWGKAKSATTKWLETVEGFSAAVDVLRAKLPTTDR